MSEDFAVISKKRYYVASTPKTMRAPLASWSASSNSMLAAGAEKPTNRLQKATIGWFSRLAKVLITTISGMIRLNESGTSTGVRGLFSNMEGSMHDSRTVANRFLRLADAAGRTLTPMQVLKLVYIAHGWMLGLYGRPLIRDQVQAWQYGPVIPRLYNAMRAYGGSVVTEELAEPINDHIDDQESDLVQQVFDLYGSKSGTALSRLTHADDTPWSQTYEPGSFGLVIPTDTIREHYERLAAK